MKASIVRIPVLFVMINSFSRVTSLGTSLWLIDCQASQRSEPVAETEKLTDLRRYLENNMVLQQCLACNTVITESCASCVCGHVFEFSKQIGGKRFSEYRAQLYSRLENKRIKKIEREQRKAEADNGQPSKENKTNTTETRLGVVRSSFKPRPHASSSTTASRGIKSKLKRFSRPTDPSLSRTALPPELVSRLPSALQEINRRLTGQNLMWWTMHWLE